MNKHWQYWILTKDDDGKPNCLPMPDKYRREMLADWHGAGRADTGEENTKEWYIKNYDNIQIHKETRLWIESQLWGEPSVYTRGEIAEMNNADVLWNFPPEKRG